MKTIEDAAKEVWVKDLDVTDFFRSGVEFAQRWIPVEEELPQEDTYVLTLSNRHNGDVYYRVIWFRHGGFFSIEQTSNITHWRPIELK